MTLPEQLTATLLQTVRSAWQWTGLDPVEIIAANAFGNLILRTRDGTFWRIMPEELSCKPIASTAQKFEQLFRNEEFQIDWRMEAIVKRAQTILGSLTDGRCYCLKIPAIVGGNYANENLGTIDHVELIACSGDIGEQLKDLPDGTPVNFKIV